ncbi:hypothetical protein ACPB8Q_06440 [Methanocaldococcus indicus]|uniref:hypothetical protein n=1 Tax=Methanocaldococcus indicus TaxID=213231 RepID=UPI003C6D4900
MIIIKHDRYDKLIWEKYRDSINPYLDEDLMENIFYLFYKYNIEILRNNEIIEKIKSNKKFKNIKNITTLSEYYSILATDYFCKKISEERKEINEIIEDLEDYLESLLSVSYGYGQGDKTYLNPKNKLELSKKIAKNRKLKELIKILGKFRKIALSKYRYKIRQTSKEKYEITLGDSLNNLILSELKNLTDDYLYLDFLRRYTEKKLLNYKLDISKNVGDFIICLDLSGSMRGNKELWAKAITISLLEVAIKEKRKCKIIIFDDDVREILEYEKINFDDIIYIASIFYGGGTNFEKPLKKALSYNGDIVFITDGEYDLSLDDIEQIKNIIKSKNIKIYSICINTRISTTLKQISDNTINIYELTQKSADSVFNKVI